ncbi:MAG: hypothetical protein Salg2KO_06040 [Salibacteraceae bacterium]
MDGFKAFWRKGWVKNLVFLGILGILFFTPVGQWVRVQILSLTLFAPSNQVENSATVDSLHKFPLQLMDQEGNSFLLSSLEGKPIFINFYASWCPPCLAEFRSMNRMQEELSDVEFLFVTRETEEDYYKFLDNTQYDYPFYKQQSKLPKQLEHESIPASYLLDANGNLVFQHVGAANWDDDALINELKSLVGV